MTESKSREGTPDKEASSEVKSDYNSSFDDLKEEANVLNQEQVRKRAKEE